MSGGMNTAVKKSVCFYAVATDLGGAEKSLLDLVCGLRESPEWSPWVLLPKDHGALVDEFRKYGIEYHTVGFPPSLFKVSRQNFWSIFALIRSLPGLFSYLWRVKRLLLEKRPSLIHTTGIKCHLLGGFFGRRHRIPVLWHLRDILAPGFTRTLMGWALVVFPVSLVSNSHATAAPFRKYGKEIQVVYNGIDPEVYRPNRNHEYQKRLNVSETTPVIGIVGVLATWKGQSQFLRAAKILADRGSQAVFVVAGGEIYDTDGESGLTRELKAQALKLGIAAKVLFTGFERDAAKVMNALDVLVHASILPEPFGRVIIEAMACGTAAVVSKLGAATEFVVDREHGLLVDPRNPEAIADAVQFLLKNPAEKTRMEKNARDLVLRDFTRERHLVQMKKALSQAINC